MEDTIFDYDDINDPKSKKSAVFCSQFAAKVYIMLQVDGFIDESAGQFSPVEMHAHDAFEDLALIVKRDTELFLKQDGKTIEKKEHAK